MKLTYSAGTAILCACALVMAQADDLPTRAELKKLEADKNWIELLKGTTKALALKGALAEPYDRAELWTLKAEAQLQQKQFVPASDSFEKASEEASATPEQKDMNKALSDLVRKCDARGYRPPSTKETPSPQPIDVFDSASRLEALKAFFNAELAEAHAALEKAKKKPVVGEISKVLKNALELPPLERASSGQSEKSDAIIDEIQNFAAETIGNWTETARARVDVIRTEANKMILSDRKIVGGGQAYRKAGLSGQHRNDLMAIIKECERLAGTYKNIVQLVGDKPNEALGGVPDKVENLHDEAKSVLNTDYTGLYRR